MKTLKILVLFAVIFIANSSTAQTKVFVTKQGKSFHKITCRLLPKKHIKTTIKRAKVKGYLACKVCVPKENKKKTNFKKKPKKATGKKYKSSSKSVVVRCSATTQKGRQCKRKTKNSSGKCWQHH